MEDYFLLKKLSYAIIAWVLGIILAFTSLVYLILHIYVPGYSLVVPIIILIIGLALIAWSSYRIAIMGRDNDI